MTSVTVKVVVRQCDDNCLAFDLIFDDGYIKSHSLDRYQISAYRGAGIRGVIEAYATEYYESLGEFYDVIQLIFV